VANRLRLLRLTDGERRAMQEAGDGVQVLAMSTCSTEFTNARTVVLAAVGGKLKVKPLPALLSAPPAIFSVERLRRLSHSP